MNIPTADESEPRMVGTVRGNGDPVDVLTEVCRDDDGTILRTVRIISEDGEMVIELDPDDAGAFAELVTKAGRIAQAPQ